LYNGSHSKESRIEINEQILHSSSRPPDQSQAVIRETAESYTKSRSNTRSRSPARRSELDPFEQQQSRLYASKVSVNNENYSEIKKKMEQDLQQLKKIQKQHNDRQKKNFVSDATKSKQLLKKKSPHNRVLSHDFPDSKLAELPQQHTPSIHQLQSIKQEYDHRMAEIHNVMAATQQPMMAIRIAHRSKDSKAAEPIATQTDLRPGEGTKLTPRRNNVAQNFASTMDRMTKEQNNMKKRLN